MKRKLMTAMVCMMVCLILCMTAFAETMGDLASPLNEGVVERDGVAYRLRKRLSSTMIVCTESVEDAAVPGFICILVTEDNEKVISNIYLDTRVLTKDEIPVTLSEKFVDVLTGTDAKTAGAALKESVNNLIGEPLVEDYLVFDIAGLDTIEDLPECDVTGLDLISSMKARLKNAKSYAESLPSDGITDLISAMSPYLSTEMKSGALIKIADKAERYQINPSIHLDVNPVVDMAGEEYISLDGNILYEALFNIFYEVNPY